MSDTQTLQTMVHEFGHFYGVEDHYGMNGLPSTGDMNGDGGNEFKEDCIYGEHKNEAGVFGTLTICPGCIGVIQDNRDNYDQVG